MRRTLYDNVDGVSPILLEAHQRDPDHIVGVKLTPTISIGSRGFIFTLKDACFDLQVGIDIKEDKAFLSSRYEIELEGKPINILQILKWWESIAGED